MTVSCLFLLSPGCTRQDLPVIRAGRHRVVTKPLQNEIVIAAVGDIMMPASIQTSVMGHKNGYDLLFEKVKSELSAADITFANLETPVDPRNPASGYPRFNARPELLSAMRRAGISAVSLANNHAMDQDSEGLKRSIDAVESSGLIFAGAGRTKTEAAKTTIVKVRDVTVAFLAFTYDTNRGLPGRDRRKAEKPGVNFIRTGSDHDLAAAAASIRHARSGADLVVVSIHWGEEYSRDPTAWQRRVAADLVEAGADLILGHHPHVLQPLQTVAAADGRAALVAFSLGNFISTQHAGIFHFNKNHEKALRGDGIILYITAAKNKGRAKIRQAEFLPVWTLRDSIAGRALYRPVSLTREIDSRMRTGSKNDDKNMLDLLTHRYDAIMKTVAAQSPVR